MDAAGQFVIAATDGRRARAQALLAAHPSIAGDPWAALVLDRGWDGDPAAPGGPRDWAPLSYAAHSVFAPAGSVRALLAAGADPNVTFAGEYGAMSALYGAAGVVHDPAMTRLLLDAGANPDDGESVYHATEARDPACLRLLLEHGATVDGTNAIAHALDDERLPHLRLLLAAPRTDDLGAVVAHAVRRGRGPETIRLLVEHGADVERPGGETWRGDVRLRTPYQHAALRGRDVVMGALAELGADTSVDPADLAVAAVARGERPAVPLPEAPDVDAQEVLVLAALGGRHELVVDLLGPDFRGVVGGSPALPLLGHAAWVGDPDLVGFLLARGADPVARGDAEWDTPLAVAALGSQSHALPGRNYVAVAERLLAAGGQLEPRMLDVADGPLAAWLEARVS